MVHLLWRLCPLVISYLLGYSFLSFAWACRRERLGVEQVACRVVVFSACLLVATLLAFGWLSHFSGTAD